MIFITFDGPYDNPAMTPAAARKTFLSATLSAVFFLLPVILWATHQRAAEIQYKHLAGLTYEITLISYTFTPSPANAYRDYLTIDWGDGSASQIPRIVEQNLPDDITYNKYVGQHTFPGPATYTISCEDPNRNGGIINIPNSINIPMYIYSELVINPFMGGYNNSPILLIPPIDNGCVDQPFYHNPGAYDPDGDSLSYRLVTCRGAQGQPIPGYTLPPATHSIHLDSITGDFFWDSPPQQGEFNIAILIEEWRNGIKIGSVLRDMQIIIVACDNRPPFIEANDTCVEAGKTLIMPVRAIDPDSNLVTLTATGGPFVITDHPAVMIPNPSTGTGHTAALLTWNTVCNHVKLPSYKVFFKAQDNGSPVKLVNIKTTQIRVVGPAPENLMATALGNSITLTWDAYSCPNAKGFYIYRKADSSGWVHDYCETGVPAATGYARIDQVAGDSVITYLDNNHGAGLVRGVKYCYIITAYYPDKAESYASNEACARLKKDVPVITNVSVNSTGILNGSIYLAWSKPTEIDTLQAHGPYEYIVSRSRSDNPANFIAIDSLSSLNDTLYTDTLLNTAAYSYLYRIDFENLTPGNRFLIGYSQIAASMYLTITPTDKKLILSWTHSVPWTNYRYTVYRKPQDASTFDSVGFSAGAAYTDRNLMNGKQYCYFIKSTGKYSSDGFVDPIINLSQQNCAIPIDNVPPCPPLLTIHTDCEQGINLLSWGNPYDSCTSDIAKYYIYFADLSGSSLTLIDSLFSKTDTTYSHKPPAGIAGCYAVIAIDSVGNRSDFSNKVCIDVSNCPTYRLPNVFTPNGDGKNDLFQPFEPYTSVESVNMTILDRWGKIVYQTHDPAILWDGRDNTTNQTCSDGTYFFICDVFEQTLAGVQKRTLKGSVTLLR
jgi:gliding motility-associated-like protein